METSSFWRGTSFNNYFFSFLVMNKEGKLLSVIVDKDCSLIIIVVQGFAFSLVGSKIF